MIFILKFGLTAFSTAFSLRAISSYINIRTVTPRPFSAIARKISKLPMCAPSNNAPRLLSDKIEQRIVAETLNVEQIKAITKQKDAIKRDGRKRKVMLKEIAPSNGSAQDPHQILL